MLTLKRRRMRIAGGSGGAGVATAAPAGGSAGPRAATAAPAGESAEPRAASTGPVRPDLGPVPPVRLMWLGVFAVLRAVGLVLVADAVARGIAGVQAGAIDTRAILVLGVSGALLRALAGWATQVAAHRVAIAVKRDLRSRLWRRIAAGSATADGAQKQGGVVVLASEGLDDLDDYYTQSLPSMIGAVAIPLVIGLRILGADWVSALIIVLTMPLIPVFMILIGKHTQERTDEATSALTRLADHLAELARGLPVLVGLGRVQDQTRSLDRIQREYRERTLATLRVAFLSALALELIATLSVAVIAVFLGLRLLYRDVPLEPALLALILAPEIYAALRDVGTAFHASQSGLSALTRVKALLAHAVGRDARRTGEGVAGPARVRVRGLSVRYAGRTAPVLRALNADLDGIVAVTGPSGSGKSTFLAALAGTLPADAVVEGAIEGVDPALVGWAPQAPRPFARTPREELELYGAADPDAALAELGLGHVADAAVAELSPGEQRRLAVARALARVDAGATLLVLDEPTAHLDAASATRVRDAVRARSDRAAIVLATHEPTTLTLAARTIPIAPTAPAPADAREASQAPSVAARPDAREAREASPADADETASSAPSANAREASEAPSVVARADAREAREATTPSPSPEVAVDEPAQAQRIEDPKLRAGVLPDLWHARHATDPEGSLGARFREDLRSAEPKRNPSRSHTATRATSHRATTPTRELARIIAPATWRWLAAIALGVIATGLGLSLTAVSGWLIVRASEEEYIMYLLVAIVGVRFFGIGRSVGRYVERLATHDAAFRVIDALRVRVWRAIAARGAGSRRLLEGGTPVDYVVTQADELRDQLPRTIPPIAIGLLSIIGITVATAFVAPQLAPVVGAVLVLSAAVGSVLAITAERGAGGTGVRERSAIVRGTAALADAADDLRGNGGGSEAELRPEGRTWRRAEDGSTEAVLRTRPGRSLDAPRPAKAALARLDDTAERLARAERAATWGAGLGMAVATFATSLLAAAVAPLTPGLLAQDLAVVALLALAALEPIGALIAAVHRVPALREVLRRLAPVLRPTVAALTGDREPADPVHRLELDGVAAQYPGAPSPAFTGLTATASTGDWLVLHGPSGSGKSTLLSVLMGALPAARGEVRADGDPLPELDADAWRTRVAWCPQEAYVFDSTLRGNLLLARDRDDAPSEADMRHTLARAGLAPLLAALPAGLDTRVGAAGSALSGGERQRLAVARALLSRAGILLLDEPTAHLDAPTAGAMMDDIRAAAGDRITVLVSHRPADIRPGDRVVSLA